MSPRGCRLPAGPGRPAGRCQIIAAVEKGAYRATVGSDARMVDLLSRAMPRRTTEMITRRMGALLQGMAPSKA